MVRPRLGSVVASLLFTLASCARSSSSSEADAGPKAAGVHVGSCDRAQSVGTCSEYGSGYLAENQLLVKSSCAKLGGTFVDAECPNTSVVGGCTLSSGEVRKFYGTGASAYDVERARAECANALHGSWR